MTDFASHMPVARRTAILRSTRQETARQIQDSLSVEEVALRTFYRNYIALDTKARLGGNAPTPFLQEHTPAWDGGYDPALGKTYQPFWRELILKCRENNADPTEYLVWRQTVWAQGTPVSPVDIRLNFAFDKFALRDSGEDFARTCLLTMQHQLEHLHFKYKTINKYTDAAAYETALHVGLQEQMTRLFVFCVAVQHGLREVAERNFGRAIHEYVLNRSTIDKVWKTLIPAELRNTASMALLTQAQGRDG